MLSMGDNLVNYAHNNQETEEEIVAKPEQFLGISSILSFQFIVNFD